MKTLEQPKPAGTTSANVITIATHDGVFHADDVFAVAAVLLCVGPRFNPLTGEEMVRIVRTRDRKAINAANIVIDVGGQYNPSADLYDHHQGAGERDNGVPYAAFGLVWENYGKTACYDTLLGSGTTYTIAGEVRDMVARSLVEVLDAHDTGYAKAGPGSLPAAISAFNPRWDEDQSEEYFALKFDDAVSFAQGILARAILSEASNLNARKIVDAAIASAEGEILVLDRYVPWQERVTRSDEGLHLKFVVFPALDGSWRAQTIQVYAGKFQPVRCEFPRLWWGLDAEQLSIATGVAGCVFCHINGFTMGNNTREGIVALCNLALFMDKFPVQPV